jgi:hypothetical protein
MSSIPCHNPARPGRRRVAAVLVLAGCLVHVPAQAQDWFLFQGIFDAELFETNTDSYRLTRNDGDIAALGRLQLWTAFQITPELQAYALGQVEVDNFDGSASAESNLEQLALRYTRKSAPWITVEAGKILSPAATYSERRLSTQNPLIGQPYLYTAGYPLGVKMSGSTGWFDYQAALLDPSGIDTQYRAIEPDSAFRPEFGFGVTPFTGLRFGMTWSKGPYLGHQINDDLPLGDHWRDYDERVTGIDFQFSRGYLELNGQALRTRRDVPYREPVKDTTWFLELKYTLMPRLYVAARYQGVEASYVDYHDYGYWYHQTQKFKSLEAGFGYRFSRDLLLKLVFETERPDHPDGYYGPNGRGRAVGMQISWAFDVVSLLSDEP